MTTIIINGRKLIISEIISGESSFSPETEFESRIIDFIKAWNSQAEFEVRTSGSTGSPKLINIRKAAMEESSNLTAMALGLQSGMTALLALDPKYIAGKMMLARALTIGMNVVAVEPTSDPFEMVDPDMKIDFIALVPMQIEQVLENGNAPRLESLHTIIIGGGPVTSSLSGKIELLSVPIFHTYGMTETITHVALRRLNGKDKSEHYRSLPGINLALDDRGCLVLSGAFIDGEVIANDQVDLVGTDRFNWLGRIDNVINSGGLKLHPEVLEPEVSDIFQSLNLGQKRLFLAGIPDNKLGEKMVLFVEGPLPDKIKVLEILKSSLVSYQCPKDIIELDVFSETKTSKLKRHEMVQAYLSEQ